ncbi:MAG: nucleotidyl transferase AbiEii/AbiGii toxin family protein [Bacteroidetes bacterium]|nr:nucleotidyl transferase AbiEii/AbiGii toxin family protein [Bacteroidota bacterium]
MNLHKYNQAFTNAIQATSDSLKILPVFIEKDYWITLALKRLSESQFRETVVFKGGTSLSKGYKLINRFSEDIDIAVISADKYKGNQLKKLIGEVEKTISVDLTEEDVPGVSSKGSRFRKTVFNYYMTGDARFYGQVSNRRKGLVNYIPYIIALQ